MRLIVTFASCLVLTATSFAEEKVKHVGDAVLSTEEVIDVLKPKKPRYKVRGIRFNNQAEPAQALALNVQFKFDSAELTQEAMEQLAPLGQALVSQELAEFSFAIDGHTDARGTEQYNQVLSEQRALSVGNYLYHNFGVEAERLNLNGKGESELYDTDQPESPMNRRVQITAIQTQ